MSNEVDRVWLKAELLVEFACGDRVEVLLAPGLFFLGLDTDDPIQEGGAARLLHETHQV